MTLRNSWKLFILLASLSVPHVGSVAIGADKLIIISPHRKSIQDEFIPMFKEHYKAAYKSDVDVDWIDQGGTSDDIRFVQSKFKSNPKSSGIDVFWGGGSSTFVDLDADKLLQSYKISADLNKQLPTSAAGVSLRNKSNTWFASALSSFGLFYNKKVMKFLKLQEPKSWEDLSDPKFFNQISLTDPRRSGTATVMNVIVIASMGWEKGWETLTKIAGNTRTFTHSSSDPIKAVVSGDAAASMVIDFYAAPKISELGVANFGFTLPEGQTVLDPDPIAILKGAPNQKVAERFVEFILSKDAQKLLVLPLGVPGGPKLSMLGRMAVNTATYEETNSKRVIDINPFTQKGYLDIDLNSFAASNPVLNDLFGATIIDTHQELKLAWAAVAKKQGAQRDALVKQLSAAPITQAEMQNLAKQWNDDVLRNKKINEWVTFAREKYKKVSKDASSN
jgi:iron(III) transport system substrate-binding protein